MRNFMILRNVLIHEYCYKHRSATNTIKVALYAKAVILGGPRSLLTQNMDRRNVQFKSARRIEQKNGWVT